MQDPSLYPQIRPQFQEQEHLKCPRCDSANTKFCYYNNYNLSQPRHFCKDCKRYWTKGGALRNIPVGGGTRKNTKRSSNPKRTSTSSSPSPSLPRPELLGTLGLSAAPSSSSTASSSLLFDQDRRMLEINGSFSSLLASSAQFGNLFERLNPSEPIMPPNGLSSPNTNSAMGSGGIRNSNSHLGLQLGSKNNSNTSSENNVLSVENINGETNCWNGGNDWPNLAIYTPGSTFQ